MTESASNLLYYGDNLDILRRYVKDETVDLVYLDPPFNSNTNYNVLFAEKDGSKAASQIQAFSDTWTWNQESESIFAEIVTAGGRVADCLQAFRTFLGRMRHAGLSRDDGPAPGGTSARDEADREHLPSLRSDGKSLSEDAHGRRLRAGELPERNHLEADRRRKPR